MNYYKQTQAIPYQQKLILVYEIDGHGMVVQIAYANTAIRSHGLLQCPFRMRLSGLKPHERSDHEYFSSVQNGSILQLP